VHTGGNTVEIKTEADSNDIMDAVCVCHDMPSNGMVGFFSCAVFCTLYTVSQKVHLFIFQTY